MDIAPAPSGGPALTEPFDDLDRMSPPQLAVWWTGRLRRMLTVAYGGLPFYRRRFEAAGFHPRGFRGPSDLARVPVFTKADVIAEQQRTGGATVGLERIPPEPGCILTLSSGTKGTTFLTWPARWRRIEGRSALRAHWWEGLRPGDTLMLTAPAWHAYASVQTYIVEQLGLRCAVVSGTYLPGFADRIADTMLAFRPRFVAMFLPIVFSLVNEARRRGMAPPDLFGSVETLVMTGAPITPGMRARVQGETGVARVIEMAGVSENLLAVECREQAGLHVVPDTCHVEVLDRSLRRPAVPGERGAVVFSSLVPWGSIYLRYDAGDAGTLDSSPCPCGLPSPRIKLVGRWEDGFRLGDQELLPYDVQIAIEEEVPVLAGVPCAILREGLTSGRLRLVLPLPPDASARDMGDAVARALRHRFQAPVQVQWIEDLPLQFKGVPAVVAEADVRRGGAQ